MGRFTDWLISERNDSDNNFDKAMQRRRKRISLDERIDNSEDKLNLKMAIYSPKTFEDVQRIIDHLKRKEPVVVELKCADRDVLQRIMDFLSGAVYALSGSMANVNKNIYLLTPSGVTIKVPINYGK